MTTTLLCARVYLHIQVRSQEPWVGARQCAHVCAHTHKEARQGWIRVFLVQDGVTPELLLASQGYIGLHCYLGIKLVEDGSF